MSDVNNYMEQIPLTEERNHLPQDANLHPLRGKRTNMVCGYSSHWYHRQRLIMYNERQIALALVFSSHCAAGLNDQ